MRDKYFIPQTLEEPFRFVLLTIDELMVLLIPLGILGFIFNSLLTGFLLGIAGVLIIKKIKGEQGHYYLINVMYWYFPPVMRFRGTPPSYIRDYLG